MVIVTDRRPATSAPGAWWASTRSAASTRLATRCGSRRRTTPTASPTRRPRFAVHLVPADRHDLAELFGGPHRRRGRQARPLRLDPGPRRRPAARRVPRSLRRSPGRRGSTRATDHSGVVLEPLGRRRPGRRPVAPPRATSPTSTPATPPTSSGAQSPGGRGAPRRRTAGARRAPRSGSEPSDGPTITRWSSPRSVSSRSRAMHRSGGPEHREALGELGGEPLGLR